MIGRVVSVKSKNTATVIVERVVTHPLYKKTYVQSKKYLVDDQLNVNVGDIVDFINCKPISKNKRWKITKVLGRDFVEIAQEAMMQKAEEAIAEVMPEPASAKASTGEGEKVEPVSEEKPEKKKKMTARPASGGKEKK